MVAHQAVGERKADMESIAPHTSPSPRKRGKPRPAPRSYVGPTRITWREACALLGIGQNSLYRMAKEQRIPAIPVGERGWQFHREPLELWLKQQLSHGLEVRP